MLTAATEIVLNVGRSTFTLRADGTILLNGRRMTLTAPAMIELNPDAPAADTDTSGTDVRHTAEAPRPCRCADPGRDPAA